MTLPTCRQCGAELGPWEGATCLYHEPASARSIADQAVMVLEQEQAPLYLHDLQRGIEREVGRRTYWGSVSAVVGSDRRFCWSGKGMYALFRHTESPVYERSPRPPRLSWWPQCAGEPLSADEIGFLLTWSGYRFQQTSLEAALGREARFLMGWRPETRLSIAGWKATVADPDGERRRLDQMRLPLREDMDTLHARLFDGRNEPVALWPVDELVDRWRGRTRDGLIERLERISRARSTERERALDYEQEGDPR